MKNISTQFLQMAIVLIGLGALAFLLWEPHLEGRNKHATLFEVYFQDPFLAFAYVASIPFFVGLYQAFKLLGYVRQNQVFSLATLKALRTIKYCAIIMIGFVAVSVFFMPLDDPEDRPPGIVMRVFVTFCSIVVATAAAMLERHFQTAVYGESEHDIRAR
jgi:uncharacterized paraquat-inducible protein A